MLKRLMLVLVTVGSLALSGCSSSCGSKCGGLGLHACETPCYGKAYKRNARQIMDFVDVYFLNYDKHDPYRCDPCLGD